MMSSHGGLLRALSLLMFAAVIGVARPESSKGVALAQDQKTTPVEDSGRATPMTSANINRLITVSSPRLCNVITELRGTEDTTRKKLVPSRCDRTPTSLVLSKFRGELEWRRGRTPIRKLLPTVQY